jgi:hypothetical protein
MSAVVEYTAPDMLYDSVSFILYSHSMDGQYC